MANPSKAKGTLFESDAVKYFHSQGLVEVTRAPLTGKNDAGDLLNVPNFTCELKAHRTITLAEYMKELKREQEIGGKRWGFVIIKKRGAPIADAYAVTPLVQAVDIIKELRQSTS